MRNKRADRIMATTADRTTVAYTHLRKGDVPSPSDLDHRATLSRAADAYLRSNASRKLGPVNGRKGTGGRRQVAR